MVQRTWLHSAGPGYQARKIPWETVVQLRADWARLMGRLGYVGDEWMAVSGLRLRYMLADEGLIGAGALARRYGLPGPKVSELLRRKIYVLPKEEARIAFYRGCSQRAYEREARRARAEAMRESA